MMGSVRWWLGPISIIRTPWQTPSGEQLVLGSPVRNFTLSESDLRADIHGLSWWIS